MLFLAGPLEQLDQLTGFSNTGFPGVEDEGLSILGGLPDPDLEDFTSAL